MQDDLDKARNVLMKAKRKSRFVATGQRRDYMYYLQGTAGRPLQRIERLELKSLGKGGKIATLYLVA